jgi:hypothetical protein
MTDLEMIRLCLDCLESATKLLQLGVISAGESEAVINLSRRWLDATIAPALRREKEP